MYNEREKTRGKASDGKRKKKRLTYSSNFNLVTP